MFGPRSPAYSIGNACRLNSTTKETPGPASYNLSIDRPRGITFAKTPRSYNHSISIPGPGAYSPVNVAKKSPIVIIGRSRRITKNNTNSPGPGAYNVQISPRSREYSFSKASKLNQNSSEILGPAEYSPRPLSNLGNSAIIIPRRPSTAKHQTPGPGAYNNSKIIENVPKWTIGKSLKDCSLGVISPKSAPKFSIKKFQQVICSESTEITSPDKKDTTGRRLRSMEFQINPGPADYNPKVHTKKSPSAIFGRSKKSLTEFEITPGPADYNALVKLERKGFTFNREKKTKFTKIEVPGPGQYNIPHTIGTDI